MPKARRKIERLKQLHAWMQSRYQTPYPTVLRFVRDMPDVSGYVEKKRNKLVITLVKSCPLYHLIDVLCHEYAHCVDYPHARVERPDHGPSWGLAMAQIYADLYDGYGWRESCEVKW